MDLKLVGRRALVTDSTAGIGAEIARVLAREGASVAVDGRSRRRGEALVAEITAFGGTACLALGNVATDEGGGRSGGLGGPRGLGRRGHPGEQRRGFRGQELGLDRLHRALGGLGAEPGPEHGRRDPHDPAVRAGRAGARLGRLIRIASTAATLPTGGTPDYAAAKAGLLSMSLAVAKALKDTSVTSNVVSPGMVLTRSLKAWFRQIGKREGWGDDAEKSVAWVPANYHHQLVARLGRVEDIANGVAYVASPLSDFMNGTNWRVDGGSVESIN